MKRHKTQCNATQDMFEANKNSAQNKTGRKLKKPKTFKKSVNSKPKHNRTHISTAKLDERFFTDWELALRYKVARPTIWRWVNSVNFPEPIRLGPNTSRWRETDVLVYELARGIASHSDDGEAGK